MPEQPTEPPPAAAVDAATPADAAADTSGFTVRLDNFTGPFDLLLQLIGKHKLDVTEVALHQVTDDFIAYIRAMGDNWDLDEASEFLLVAATLLDLKAARLLPAAEVEDEEDLALLEARDLLFARLLQYKAFKEAAAYLSDLEEAGGKRYPRAVSMEPRYAEALPDLVLGIGATRLFKLALKQFSPKPGPPQVSIAHIHQIRVSVREHAALLRDRLRRAGSAAFSLLVADCENTLEVVARFLALLELYREGLIDFDQPVSLDELTVRWIGGDAPDSALDIDDYEGTRPDPDTAATDPADADPADPADADPADPADPADADADPADPAPVLAADLAVADADAGLVVAGAGSADPGLAADQTDISGFSGADDLGVGAADASPAVPAVAFYTVRVDGGDAVGGGDLAPAVGEAEFDGLDMPGGAEGAAGATVSDAGDGVVGRVDAVGDRREVGGHDDEAAAAAVEERQ